MNRRIVLADNDPVVVVGAGGVGCGLAGVLSAGGRSVVVTTRAEDHLDALNTVGLSIVDGVGNAETYPVRACRPDQLGQSVEGIKVAYIATKADGVVESLELVRDNLADDGVVILVQNGLVTDAAVEVLPAERVLAGVAFLAANRNGPARASVSVGPGANLLVGELDGVMTSRLQTVVELTRTDPWDTEATTNLLGVQWSKLAVNSATNSLSVLGGWSVGDMAADERGRRTFAQLVAEVVVVGDSLGVNFAPLGMFDVPTAACAVRDGRLGDVEQMLQQGMAVQFATVRPSSLQDYEAGARSELAWLTGYVVEKGRQLGVPTPASERILASTRILEAGAPRTADLVSAGLTPIAWLA